MPSTEPSSRAWYSPEPASSTAGSPIESSSAIAAARMQISEIEIARSSSRSAPETRSWGSFHSRISRTAVTAKTIIVSTGALRREAPNAAAIRTTQIPAVKAITGESPE